MKNYVVINCNDSSNMVDVDIIAKIQTTKSESTKIRVAFYRNTDSNSSIMTILSTDKSYSYLTHHEANEAVVKAIFSPERYKDNNINFIDLDVIFKEVVERKTRESYNQNIWF